MNDFSHCPRDANGNEHYYFSPEAPPADCYHQTPEPSSLVLVLVAIGTLLVWQWVTRWWLGDER